MPEQQPHEQTLIGIFGGTFDPVHYGHITPLTSVLEQISFKKILALPCFIPPHKSAPNTNIKDRMAMLEIALQSLPNIEIDDRELKRNKPSYTFDTLSELAATYPRHHLCFIIGMDSMLAFDTWYRWQDILQLSSLVVMKRGGYQAHFNKTLAPFIKKNEVNTAKELYQGETGKILFVETPTVAISSTDIRKNIATHQSNKGLLPTEVIHYIEQHGLYL